MDDHHLSNITKLEKKKPWVAIDGTLTRGHLIFNFNFFFKFCDMESLAKVSKDSKISQFYT